MHSGVNVVGYGLASRRLESTASMCVPRREERRGGGYPKVIAGRIGRKGCLHSAELRTALHCRED